MNKYIEVIKIVGGNCVKRLNVTGKSDRMIDKIEIGLSINLNHDAYISKVVESEIELPVI